MARVLVRVVISVAATWVVLLVALAVARPDGTTLADGLKVLPDTVRLVRSLARDPQLPRSVRRTLWLLGGYLAMPIDVVPDFIPVLGYADDATVVAIALRRVVRAAGPGALERHWTGTPAGLVVVRRLAGLRWDTPRGSGPAERGRLLRPPIQHARCPVVRRRRPRGRGRTPPRTGEPAQHPPRR